MKLYVFDSRKNQYSIEIDENASIQDFKNQFCEKYNQDIDTFKLIFKGREIKNDKRLSDYSIVEGSKIVISKLFQQEESKIPNIPQQIASIPQKLQISSEIKLPQPISYAPEIPQKNQSDLMTLQKLNANEMNLIIDAKVNKLKEMGFDDKLSRQVLAQTNENLEDALAILVAQNEGLTPVERVSSIVDDFMKTNEGQFVIFFLANNPDEYETVFANVPDKAQNQFLSDNKQIFLEACQNEFVIEKPNRINRIEELKGQPIEQGRNRIEEIDAMNNIDRKQGNRAMRNIEEVNENEENKGEREIGSLSISGRMNVIEGMKERGKMSSLGSIGTGRSGMMSDRNNRESNKIPELKKNNYQTQDRGKNNSLFGSESEDSID